MSRRAGTGDGGARTGEHFEGDDADDPHVGAVAQLHMRLALLVRQSHFRCGVASDVGRDDCQFLGTRSVVQIDELPGEVRREPHDVRRVESSVIDALTVKVIQCLEHLRHKTERADRHRRREAANRVEDRALLHGVRMSGGQAIRQRIVASLQDEAERQTVCLFDDVQQPGRYNGHIEWHSKGRHYLQTYLLWCVKRWTRIAFIHS